VNQRSDNVIPIAGSETVAAGAQCSNLLTYTFAKRFGVVTGNADSVPLTVYHRPGMQLGTITELRRHLQRPLHFQPVADEAFRQMLQRTYEQQDSGQAMEIADNIGSAMDLDSVARELREPEDLLEANDDAPIIRLINALLTEAIKENASDIHIEPYENKLSVRLRVDGVLREVLETARALAPLVASRIKVMAKLDIAEKRLPQDGRIALRVADRSVDVRVSTMPTGSGERVVLRLLDKQAGRLTLEHLGMAPSVLGTMEKIIHKPFGITLVTGPTGSGKTTTLYAVLTRLNDQSRNIMTVEDPIEYDLMGISQTAVNRKVEMSFARGLRAILRQDPDVVMVGEIRDLETARIAVQASLTGHQVFSTLHTNTAIGAITRLKDMGVEPFLVSSSLAGVAAQRLLRRLCPQCKTPYQADAIDCDTLGVSHDDAPTLYKPAGCPECNHLGYRGRSGIYEVIDMDQTLKTMIHDGASEQEMEKYARTLTPSLRQDGIDKVLAGETSLEELLRVLRAG
jgi:general secretion pathway protein E